jgi:hypothetical protein
MNIEEKLMYVDLIKIMVQLQCTIQNPNFTEKKLLFHFNIKFI